VAFEDYTSAAYLVPRGIDFGLPVVAGLIGYGVIRLGRMTYRKVAQRRCRACRYDMRASMGLACPECGHVAPDQEEIEHGYVRRWVVGLGCLGFLPAVWTLGFLIAAGLGLWLDRKPEQFREECSAVVAAGTSKEKGERKLQAWTFAGRGEISYSTPGVNGVSRWVMRQLRHQAGCEYTLRASQRATGERPDRELIEILDGLAYRDAQADESLLSGEYWSVSCVTYNDSLEYHEKYRVYRYLAHYWVNPMFHFGRYFAPNPNYSQWWTIDPDDHDGLHIDASGYRPGEESLYDDAPPVVIPDALLEKILARGGFRHLHLRGVVCDDRVMRIAAESPDLMTISANHVRASPEMMLRIFKGSPRLGGVNLRYDRPVTDQEALALPEPSKAEVEVSWLGEAAWSDEAVASLLETSEWRLPSLSGDVRPGGWKKTVAVAGVLAQEVRPNLNGRFIYKHMGAPGEISDDDLGLLRKVGLWVAVSETSGIRFWD
jgi:hypothetical protein